MQALDPNSFVTKYFRASDSKIGKRLWSSILDYDDGEKFEEFLEKLAVASQDQDLIFRLIGETFNCPPNSFNANHLAVAKLMASGKCHTVLTTNFDVSVENACKHIGFQPIVVLPDQLSNPLQQGSIVKLHGCARYGQIVADSTSLNQMAQRRMFRKVLEHSLSRPTVTMGYSGVGDVDVAVELFSLSSPNLIFGSHLTGHSNPLGPGVTIKNNLMVRDKTENILAHWSPDVVSHTGNAPSNRRSIAFAGYDAETLEDMLIEISNQKGTDLHLHRLLLMHRGLKTRSKPFPNAPDFVQIPAYRIGLEVSNGQLNGIRPNPFTEMWNGFAFWRLRYNQASQNAYRAWLDGFEVDMNQNGQLLVCEKIFAFAAQNYWEVDGRDIDGILLERAERIFKHHVMQDTLAIHTSASIYVKLRKRAAEVQFLQGSLSGADTISLLSQLGQLALDLRLGPNSLEISYTAQKVARFSKLAPPKFGGVLREDFLGLMIHQKKRFSHWLGPSRFERWLFSIIEVRLTPKFDWLFCSIFRRKRL